MSEMEKSDGLMMYLQTPEEERRSGSQSGAAAPQKKDKKGAMMEKSQDNIGNAAATTHCPKQISCWQIEMKKNSNI